ncbi:MAG: hypothetical protein PHP03_00800 [Candidatus Pacebacteria bacterium]|nr:hypothetical protein [Candidatus Paceibacterota bacterium]
MFKKILRAVFSFFPAKQKLTSKIPDFREKEGSGDITQLKPVTEEFVKKLHEDFEKARPYLEKLARENEKAKNPCAYCHRRFDCNNGKDCKIIIGSAA